MEYLHLYLSCTVLLTGDGLGATAGGCGEGPATGGRGKGEGPVG